MILHPYVVDNSFVIPSIVGCENSRLISTLSFLLIIGHSGHLSRALKKLIAFEQFQWSRLFRSLDCSPDNQNDQLEGLSCAKKVFSNVNARVTSKKHFNVMLIKILRLHGYSLVYLQELIKLTVYFIV